MGARGIMMRHRMLQHAWIPIAALALVLAPAATWAQPPPPVAGFEAAHDDAGNNTTEPAGVRFVPTYSSKQAIPGKNVTHFFRLVNGDDKTHRIDLVVSPIANETGNQTDWRFSYGYSGNDTLIVLDEGESLMIWVGVSAPLLPPDELRFYVKLEAFEKGDLLAGALAQTSYLLP